MLAAVEVDAGRGVDRLPASPRPRVLPSASALAPSRTPPVSWTFTFVGPAELDDAEHESQEDREDDRELDQRCAPLAPSVAGRSSARVAGRCARRPSATTRGLSSSWFIALALLSRTSQHRTRILERPGPSRGPGRSRSAELQRSLRRCRTDVAMLVPRSVAATATTTAMRATSRPYSTMVAPRSLSVLEAIQAWSVLII